MTEQDAEAAELTNLMKKNPSSDPSRSEKTASQAANSIVSQLSDLAGDSKVKCLLIIRRANSLVLTMLNRMLWTAECTKSGSTSKAFVHI
jgi:hypothetical protein